MYTRMEWALQVRMGPVSVGACVCMCPSRRVCVDAASQRGGVAACMYVAACVLYLIGQTGIMN